MKISKLRITWKKSAIGYARNQKRAVKALGFHVLNDVVEHNDSPQIRGMIRKIRHLVKVEEIGREGEA
ncbi:MAG: 50S ribosomal protein L30 [Chloroflexi bacterium]|nr:50S ribosomal protein L30 [Chloroflexota bacterium]MBT9165527.1 50S ribosomal protein L30 [Chloroflexota bacterium]